MDGKHIVMRAPHNRGSYCFNYNTTFSIVLLAVVDANYKFTYVDVGCNGRVSDGGVYRESSLNAALETNTVGLPPSRPLPMRQQDVPFVMVGDEAFPLKENVMKPFPGGGLTDERRIFNYRLSRARRISENVFGIMAHRFKVFQSAIRVQPDKVEHIILAVCVLHNFLRTKSMGYACPGQIDYENESGDVIDGEWRSTQHNNILVDLPTNDSNRSSLGVREVREEFMDYFNTNGQVPWQWSHTLKQTDTNICD
ncbi:putative nuclease HARBI1 [Lineus longissimus]|uniref:putative nuclease HARBI1 n=1 Tax=Lineus longissimus TaxID=88925 RepID=UPI00315CF198